MNKSKNKYCRCLVEEYRMRHLFMILLFMGIIRGFTVATHGLSAEDIHYEEFLQKQTTNFTEDLYHNIQIKLTNMA